MHYGLAFDEQQQPDTPGPPIEIGAKWPAATKSGELD
jgi:hypothetical protein